jgi:hypothetical protein
MHNPYSALDRQGSSSSSHLHITIGEEEEDADLGYEDYRRRHGDGNDDGIIDDDEDEDALQRQQQQQQRAYTPPHAASRRRLNMGQPPAGGGAGRGVHGLPESLTNSRTGSHAGSRDRSRNNSRTGSRPESVDGGDDEGGGVGAAAAGDGGVQSEFRERLWGYLLGNMVRAIDEVYFLCELECGRHEIETTVHLLEESAGDFKALVRRVRSQEIFAQSPGLRSMAWDVGRTDVRPSPRHAEMIHAITGRKSRGGGDDGGGDDDGGGGGAERGWQTAGRGGKPAAGGAQGNGSGKGGKQKKHRHRGGGGGGGRSSLDGDPRQAGAGGIGAGGGQVGGHQVGILGGRVGRRSKRASDGDGYGDAIIEESGSGGGSPLVSPTAFKRSFTDPDLSAAAAAAAAASPGSEKTTAANAKATAKTPKVAGKPPLPVTASASSTATPAAAVPAAFDRSLLTTSWADEVNEEDAEHTAGEDDASEGTAEAVPHAWGEKRNWGAILAPLDHYGASAGSHQALASRLMNRGKSPGLHAKLMSPERKKKTPMVGLYGC